MSFIKYIIPLIFILTINCGGNKVSNYHGVKKLETKYSKLQVNVTNKNDLINIIGPPSSISDFNKNKWFYIERLKSNQSLIKLGTQKIKKNNILVVELNNNGILIDKKLLNMEDMNDVKYLETLTEKDFKKNNFMFSLLTSLREKINAPARNRGK
tara:strand:- start:180 stop:644 length:465 start_codon:yes stop_codon:yes gene_type:complete